MSEVLVLTWQGERTLPPRAPSREQDRELTGWFEAEGIPHEKVYALRFDPDARRVTVYRYAYRAFPERGLLGPCVFVGYLAPDGTAVMDPEWGEAAKEWPTTHDYQSDPPAWLSEVAYCLQREVT